MPSSVAAEQPSVLPASIGAVLTPQRAADYLTLSVVSLARMRIAGNGPKFVRLGDHKVGYRQSDLDAYLDGRVRTSTSQK